MLSDIAKMLAVRYGFAPPDPTAVLKPTHPNVKRYYKLATATGNLLKSELSGVPDATCSSLEAVETDGVAGVQATSGSGKADFGMLDWGGDFTLCLWFTKKTAGDTTFLQNGRNNYAYATLGINTSNVSASQNNNTSLVTAYTISFTPPPVGARTCLQLVKLGSTVRLRVGNGAWAQTTVTGTINASNYPTGLFDISQHSNAPVRAVSVDTLRIFDTALSDYDLDVLLSEFGAGADYPINALEHKALVALFDMDATTGNVLTNRKVGGPSAALSGTLTTSAGHVGQALTAGSGGIARVADATPFKTPEFSAAFWCKGGMSTNTVIAEVNDNDGFSIQPSGDGNIHVNSQSSTRRQKTNADLRGGNWHFVVVTANPAAGRTRIYVDGVDLSTMANQTYVPDWGTAPFTLFDRNAPVARYAGALDHFRWFSKELTQAEVRTLMQEVYPYTPPAPTGGVGMWGTPLRYSGDTLAVLEASKGSSDWTGTRIAYSLDDGATWRRSSGAPPRAEVYRAVDTGSKIAAISGSTWFMSVDSLTGDWATAQKTEYPVLGMAGGISTNAILWDASIAKFVAATEYGDIMTSADGLSYTEMPGNNLLRKAGCDYPREIVKVGGVYYVQYWLYAKRPEYVFHSTDLKNWAPLSFPRPSGVPADAENACWIIGEGNGNVFIRSVWFSAQGNYLTSEVYVGTTPATLAKSDALGGLGLFSKVVYSGGWYYFFAASRHKQAHARNIGVAASQDLATFEWPMAPEYHGPSFSQPVVNGSRLAVAMYGFSGGGVAQWNKLLVFSGKNPPRDLTGGPWPKLLHIERGAGYMIPDANGYVSMVLESAEAPVGKSTIVMGLTTPKGVTPPTVDGLTKVLTMPDTGVGGTTSVYDLHVYTGPYTGPREIKLLNALVSTEFWSVHVVLGTPKIATMSPFSDRANFPEDRFSDYVLMFTVGATYTSDPPPGSQHFGPITPAGEMMTTARGVRAHGGPILSTEYGADGRPVPDKLGGYKRNPYVSSSSVMHSVRILVQDPDYFTEQTGTKDPYWASVQVAAPMIVDAKDKSSPPKTETVAGTLIPAKTATSEAATSAQTASGSATGYEIAKAFDKDDATSWSSAAAPFPVVVEVACSSKLSGYSLRAGHEDSHVARAPKAYKVYGSTDGGTTWDTVEDVKDAPAWVKGERRVSFPGKGTAVSPEVPAPVDPLWDKVKFAINFNGDPSVLADFQKNHAVGGAQPDASQYGTTGVSAPGRHDSGGVYFGASTDNGTVYTLNGTLDMNGDFCVDFWMMPEGPDGYVMSMGNKGSPWGLRIAAGRLTFVYDYYDVPALSCAVQPGAWVHVALLRSGLSLILAVDGVRVGDYSVSGTLLSTHFIVGGGGIPGNLARRFFGRLDDVRITCGHYRFILPFTPPATPMPIKGPDLTSAPQLHIKPTTSIADSSGNNTPVAVTGSLPIEATGGPYGSPCIVSSGGSADNRIQCQESLFAGTTEWTIEAWIKPAGRGSICGEYRHSTYIDNLVQISTNGKLTVYKDPVGGNGTVSMSSAAVIPTDRWTHFAVTYHGAGGYKLWINGVLEDNSPETINMFGVASYAGQFWWLASDNYREYYFNYNGRICDMRVTRKAKYAAAFTPPTDAFAGAPVEGKGGFDPTKTYNKVKFEFTDNFGMSVDRIALSDIALVSRTMPESGAVVKKVTSEQSSPTTPAGNLADGMPRTYWETAAGTALPASVYIDTAEAFLPKAVYLAAGPDPLLMPETVVVNASADDGASWTQIMAIPKMKWAAGESKVIDLPPLASVDAPAYGPGTLTPETSYWTKPTSASYPDESGKGVVAVVQGAGLTYAPGAGYEGADAFATDGSQNWPRLSIHYSCLPPTNGDITIEVAVKLEKTGARQAIWGHNTASAASEQFLTVNDDGTIYIVRHSMYGDVPCTSPAGAFKFGEWQHVAVTVKGFIWTIFVQGKAVATGTAEKYGWYTSSYPLEFGAQLVPGYNEYAVTSKGLFSQIRVTKGIRYTENFTVGKKDAVWSKYMLSLRPAANQTKIAMTGLAICTSPAGAAGGMLFDGSDKVTYANSCPEGMVLDHFTFEMWFKAEANPSSGSFMALASLGGDATADNRVVLLLGANGAIHVGYKGSEAYTESAALGASQAGAMHHLALSKAGTNYWVFLNGTLVGSVSRIWAPLMGSALVVGSAFRASAEASKFVGLIKDVRLTKGVARYIESFTPPSALPLA